MHTQYAIWTPCDVALLYAMPQHSYYSKPFQSSVLARQLGNLKLKRHRGLQVCVKLGTGALNKSTFCFIVMQFHTSTESLLQIILVHSQMSLWFIVAGVDHMSPITHLSSASHWDHAFGILVQISMWYRPSCLAKCAAVCLSQSVYATDAAIICVCYPLVLSLQWQVGWWANHIKDVPTGSNCNMISFIWRSHE